ncbi:FAD:protein FMN transferase [Danxiaibacter flavus]|uniref:FAD:protein FMN transferase n=1 Tax=Danxiaibacter flavus TaxID=3049108 RepID=A0ABV3ZN46_9BACT|nr:FAD:protein FMN transferase [Chitinophagaceae bacterium DXS]
MQPTINELSVLKEFRRSERLMGNAFEITVVCEEKEVANEAILLAIEEIRRIERLFTTFDNDSQTNLINRNAGVEATVVDREVYELIERSIRISVLTDGAFDITFGSIDKSLWNFDQTMTKLPDPKLAKSMVRLINFRNIVLNKENCSVLLKEKGMRIGFGGIGKGYAAEMARQLLQRKGIVAGVINASGDISTWGMQANGKPWTIGIADPDNASLPFSYLNISNMAIATSGNYEKFAVIGGKRYSHTINPKTGLPVSGIKSVTIICPNAEIADAMATPVSVMGVKAGLGLINQMHGIACIIIDDYNNIYSSKNIQIR